MYRVCLEQVVLGNAMQSLGGGDDSLGTGKGIGEGGPKKDQKRSAGISDPCGLPLNPSR